jgi:hypothetical protein
MARVALPDEIRETLDMNCWEWQRGRIPDGYGVAFDRATRRHIGAHRVYYEELVGPIPDGMTIDHLCRNPACVNPGHLEPVTMRENNLRGESPWAQNARKTHCPAGHPYDEANTRIGTKGDRKCRACEREYAARKRRERKAITA